MRNPAGPEVPQADELPPLIRETLSGPLPPGRSWAWTIVPAYLGLFVWVPFHDRLGLSLAGSLSPASACAYAALGVLLSYFLLYDVPAHWGCSSELRLIPTAASTFGATGAEWLGGPGIALGSLVWYAVSIHFAIRLTFLGLISCGLIDPSCLAMRPIGSFEFHAPVFLITALFWIFITGMAGVLRLGGVIAALMQVYSPVALILLALTAILCSAGLPANSSAPPGLSPPGAGVPHGSHGGTFLIQMIFGFVALPGLMAVDWGSVVHDRRDVRIGGWLGLVLAGSLCAIASLISVAEATRPVGPLAGTDDGLALASPYTFHGAVFLGIGGVTGGGILLLFGLAALAPACYAVRLFGTRLATHWGGLRQSGWIWLGSLASFPLIATSWADRIEAIVGLMGAVFAPAVGAIVADALRQRLAWQGIRAGLNPPGVAAWAVGLVVGLVPTVGPIVGLRAWARFQPASVFAFLSAVIVYGAMAYLGMERPRMPIPEGAVAPRPQGRQDDLG